MPKQIGPHQLRGKMNNVCYYQQKGMQTGLARRINPNMGDRLRTEESFAVTREANSFFGACSIVAKIIIDMTSPRASFLHKYDRQAILTKGVFNASKQMGDATAKDSLRLNSGYSNILPNEYAKIAKNDLRSFFSNIPVSLPSIPVGAEYTISLSQNDLQSYCRQFNSIGILFTLIDNCYIYGLQRNSETNKFEYPSYGSPSRSPQRTYLLEDGDIDLNFTMKEPDDAMSFCILIAEPIKRMIGNRAVTMRTGSGCCMIGYNIEA